MANRPEAITELKATLGEGPLWLQSGKQLGWIDIEGKCIHYYTPSTGEIRTINVGERIGTFAEAEDGRLVCALQNGLHYLNLADESLELIHDPEPDLPGNRFNDGKCDPSGRFWAGTMPASGNERSGSMYRLDRDGQVHKLFSGVGCSNGLTWNAEETIMYYIDTSNGTIDRFDYDAATGNISNRQVVVVVPPEHGIPDGMTIDAEGMLWVALWGGYGVRRYNPLTGECLEKVELPVSQVTSCCFGGEELDVLYMTSARIGISEEQLQQEPLAGSTFKYVPGVKGLKMNVYKNLSDN